MQCNQYQPWHLNLTNLHIPSLHGGTLSVSEVCASHDKGKYVKGVCEFGCIGCGICKKKRPEDAIKLVEKVVVIDQERCASAGHASTCVRGMRL